MYELILREAQNEKTAFLPFLRYTDWLAGWLDDDGDEL
jgi:hypothetical protein